MSKAVAREINLFLARDTRPLRERGARYLPDAAPESLSQTRPDLQDRIYRNYLATLALLGRIAEIVPKHDLAERTNLDEAFIDANVVLRRKGADIFFERSSRGGYSMFDGNPLPTPEDSG